VNRLFRLGPVLRARKAQEDAASSAVVQSRAELRDAAALVRRRQLELAGSDAPSEGTARAVVASLVARQSLAASLSGAHRMVSDAEETTRELIAELADAAKRRRAIELMAERHAETVRLHDIAVDQVGIDELAVTSKQRAAARGVDAVSERRANTLRHGAGRDGAAPDTGRPDTAERAEAAKRASIDLAASARTVTVQRTSADADPGVEGQQAEQQSGRA
jgi:hypothetical protein